MAAAADLWRVHFFQMGSPYEPVPFRIPQDVEELSRRIHQTNAALVVVDLLIEFIDGKTDAHKSQPVRQARHTKRPRPQSTVAIVVIIHLNKGASTDPLIRHEGSAAFTQVRRGAMLLGPDPNDPEGERGSRRVLAVSSSNLAQLAPSLLYEIRTATVRGDTGEEIVTAEIACVSESDATGSDLLGAGADVDEPSSALDEAVQFLIAELSVGPQPASKMKKSAGEVGISAATLRRAKDSLQISVSPVAEWLPALAQELGAKQPMRVPRFIGRLAAGEAGVVMMTDVRGASNAKARRELGWRPAHASWRQGFAAA